VKKIGKAANSLALKSAAFWRCFNKKIYEASLWLSLTLNIKRITANNY